MSKTTGETPSEEGVIRQITQANNRISAGTDPELHTMNRQNDSEMKKEAEERKLHRMAKVHDILEMWQGSRNLRATQKESRTQNKQLTTVEYFLDAEEIVKTLWSLFQHDCVAAFTLSETSPLPPPLSANDLHGGQTQIFNVCRIRKVNHHPVESDDDCTPDSISDTEDWLHWNGDLDSTNDCEDHCTADIESNIEQDNSIMVPECPEQWDMSATPNVPGLIWHTLNSKSQAERVLVTVSAIKMRSNKAVKKKLDRMYQCFTSFIMYLDRQCELHIYFRRMVSSSL